MTFAGVEGKPPNGEPLRGSPKRRLNETQHRESKTHKMGMQISCGVHPEVSHEKHLRMGKKRARADHPGLGPAEGERPEQEKEDRQLGSTEDIRIRNASESWPDRFERFTNQASGSAGGK